MDDFRGCYVKIARAEELTDQVVQLLAENPPYHLSHETNCKNGRSVLRRVPDPEAIERLGILCGDATHNLRTAVNHAYTTVVGPYASEKDMGHLQFPAHKSSNHLRNQAKRRKADLVSDDFLDAMVGLAAHGDHGGNHWLYLVHDLNLQDKYVNLIPKNLSTGTQYALLRQEVPELPNVPLGAFAFGHDEAEFIWHVKPPSIEDWLAMRIPANGIRTRRLKIPVDIAFEDSGVGSNTPLVPALNAMRAASEHAIRVIRQFTKK